MITIDNKNDVQFQNGVPGIFDRDYKGLSTDTKPTEMVAVNSLFLELDTGDFYYFTGSAWAKVGGAE